MKSGYFFALALWSLTSLTHAQDQLAAAATSLQAPAASASVCRNAGSGAFGAPSARYLTVDAANSAGWFLENDGSGNCFKEALCQSNSVLQADHKTCACPPDLPYWDGNACGIGPAPAAERIANAPKVRNCRTGFEFGPTIARCDANDPERIYVLSNVLIKLANGSSSRYGEGAKWQTIRRGDSATLQMPPSHPLENAFINVTKIDDCNWHADGFAGSYKRHIEFDGNVNFCQ